MEDLNLKSLKLHKENQGKLGVYSKVNIKGPDDLALAYSPGVAEPCREIFNNKNKVYDYTFKGNTIAVITDGSAVLGLGNIGPEAALPVMEGKSILFKEFAGLNAFPICINSTDTDEIVQTIINIAPTFGGINLEDISAPRCFEIEKRLIEALEIPVFHDDQHGTAIVTLAALLNACKLLKKDITKLKVVVSGMGAAGNSIVKILKAVGVKTIYGLNSEGIICNTKYESYNFAVKELLDENVLTDFDVSKGDNLANVIKDADCFIGVSAANILTRDMVNSMNDNPIVFALANPHPEISFEEVKQTKASVYGTGRSDYPNQINNVLAFPGIFKGALESRSKQITMEMKIAASIAIANLISDSELTAEYIIPSPFDKRTVTAVSQAIINIANNY